jgi:hypothetical protein
MRYKSLWMIALIILITAACVPLTPGVGGTAAEDILNAAATQTAAAFTTALLLSLGPGSNSQFQP